jgi:hypothetical protein
VFCCIVKITDICCIYTFFQVPGGVFVTFIIPLSDSRGNEFMVGVGQAAEYMKIDWDMEKVTERKVVYQVEGPDDLTRHSACAHSSKWVGIEGGSFPPFV